MKIKSFLVALGLLQTISFGAFAQDARSYPTKAVRLIVPFAPGGAVDILARVVGQKLAEQWHQPVVIENRDGANGIVAAEVAARAPADGYTLFLGTNGTHATNASLYARLPYDPLKDFAPIGLLASIPHVIVVNPSLPVNSLQELKSYARAHPGELTFGSAGNGSSLHLSGELFKESNNLFMLHIPYRGGAPAVADLLAKRTDVMFAVAPLVIPYIQSGQLRALAIMANHRAPQIPQVPTTTEAGNPGIESTAWIGLLAPAATPADVTEKINLAVNLVLRDKAIEGQLTRLGFVLEGGSAPDFAKFMIQETSKWKSVVQRSGAKLD